VDNFHERTKRNGFISPGIGSLLAHFTGMVLQVIMVLLQGIGKVLYGVGWALCLVYLQQPYHAVVGKVTGTYHFGYMFLLHPLQPIFVYGPAYLCGYIIYVHSFYILLQLAKKTTGH
jgi:hypothetical protein